MTGISKSQVSRLCEEVDERVGAFLERPLEADWPYLWIDATYVKVRQAGRIVSVATIIAVAVNGEGRREVLGIATGTLSLLRRATCELRQVTVGTGYANASRMDDERIDFDYAYARYVLECARNGNSPLTAGEFRALIAALADASGEQDG